MDHRPVGQVERLDVTRAHHEVWEALQHRTQELQQADVEIARYARFRGVQERWGRNWRDWPEPARSGDLRSADCDDTVAAFHLAAQHEVQQQLRALQHRLMERDMYLGLDLTVGVHPDGYDAWSRQALFADDVSVGAPPDPGFPSGQDWGFRPVLPDASRQEGHRYLAASLRHQMAIAGVIRVDHVMAFERLYWIPQGMELDQGSYVDYPADELFAVLTLESHRNRCEVVGENLGTVPDSINRALDRHRIHGLYLAQFQAVGSEGLTPPRAGDMALIGSHDTPTLAGWIVGDDIDERLRFGLMDATGAASARQERHELIARLTALLGLTDSSPRDLLLGLLTWLGGSSASTVAPWLEDLWLEHRGVNLPGTPASLRANWQRPMSLTLEEMTSDPLVEAAIGVLGSARQIQGG
jgi:4-alpha-glucanotransferase